MKYRLMRIEDYPEVRGLWTSTPGVQLSDADSEDNIGRFLSRNENMSFVAVYGERIVGTVLTGTDGRRGYLHHLLVTNEFRRRGIATELVRLALESLSALGIKRSYIYLLVNNDEGRAFWTRQGWDQCEFLVLSRWHDER